MIKEKIKINILTKLAILSSLASVLGIVDKMISSSFIPYLPGIKIGLANVIILYSILNFNFKYSFIIILLKIVIVCLLFGSITTFIIGGTSSILSFFVMYYIYKKETNKLNIITISIVGGFIHINTQLIIIGLIYNIGKEIYIYGFILIIISFITSIINGLITKRLNKVIYIK